MFPEKILVKIEKKKPALLQGEFRSTSVDPDKARKNWMLEVGPFSL